MASEQLPVTGAIITWARERAGFTLEGAAKKFARIADWETGKAAPTYPQLESMAEVFKIPVATFFFPEPPKVPPIQESFRTLPATEFDQIPRPVRLLLRKAKAYQLNLAELTRGRNPAPRLITRDLRFKDDISAEQMASLVRKYLGVEAETQFSWSDDDVALKIWRRTLQDAGVFVFKDAFFTAGFFGFSLYDDIFPIIYVNNSATKTRQMFTLFHELAHIIFHTSGIDTLNDVFIENLDEHKKRIEVLCNRFAAQFLVPEDAFTAALSGRPRTEATAEALAARFHVSREVIYRKFLERNWITQSDYANAAKKWSEQQRRSGKPGGDYYNTKIAYLGREYMTLAFAEYNQNRIDDAQLADYLDVKLKNVSKLEEYFMAGSQ